MRNKKAEAWDTIKLAAAILLLGIASLSMMSEGAGWLLFPAALLAGPILAFGTKNEFQVKALSYLGAMVFLAFIVVGVSKFMSGELILESRYPAVSFGLIILFIILVLIGIEYLWARPIIRFYRTWEASRNITDTAE
jgi:hypothetical protein